MEKRSPNIAVDRISELPESIIHDQIMSFLTRRDRAQTSVLSKTWYRLNKTYPALDFDYDAFSHDSPVVCNCPESFRKRADESLSRFSQRNLCLKSLRVIFSYHSYLEYKSDVNRWVESAIDNKVEKLKLFSRHFHKPYALLQRVYFCDTLTTLKLDECVLDQPLSAFRTLRKLTLSDCRLKKGSLVLKQSDCPALESLVLCNCDGFKSLHIYDLVQLHTVKIKLSGVPKTVEIASLSIQKLSVEEFCYNHNHWLGVEGFNIYGCRLKFLHLYSNSITGQVLNDLLSELPLLEDLYVTGCGQLEALQVSNARLKTLVVFPFVYSRLKSIDIKVPTIKNFIFESCIREHTEINVQANCCLETLVLGGINRKTDELVAKFRLLQSLSLFGCHKLETIEIPNVHLKRLHIARCSKLKDVKVASREFEMYCKDRDDLEISIPDPEHAYEIQRCNRVHDDDFKFVCFQKMVVSLIKDL